MRIAFIMSALVTLIIVGCGSDNPTRTVTVSAPPAETSAEETTPLEETTEPANASDDVPESDSESSGSRCIRVPDVEGKDHQLGQDTLQAAGLYLLREEDATGQGRLLIIDRNWTVVRQSPKAGRCVSDDTTITLYSKKDGE